MERQAKIGLAQAFRRRHGRNKVLLANARDIGNARMDNWMHKGATVAATRLVGAIQRASACRAADFTDTNAQRRFEPAAPPNAS